MIYVFLNGLSNNGKGVEAKAQLEKLFEGQELKILNVREIKNAADSCKALAPEDKIVIAGGDGTLSRFANDIYELHLNNEIFFLKISGLINGRSFSEVLALRTTAAGDIQSR